MYMVEDFTTGNLMGYFYLDLFPREGKFAHACVVPVVASSAKSFYSDEFNVPFSVIICNFTIPTKKVPSLLSLREAETLFHEFGHCLHATLSTSRHSSQSGTNVVWDFVETPSQFMENWLWNKEVFTKISKHYLTGKKIPGKELDNMLNSRKSQVSYDSVRQLIYTKLDLDLHTGKTNNAKEAYRKLYKMYLDFNIPVDSLFPAGFGHLVGYDAGYYSYMWALVYAQDAFSLFETAGSKNILTNKEIGMKWRNEVLEKGSTEDEMKLIKNFLGRKPSQKAFLKEIGI